MATCSWALRGSDEESGCTLEEIPDSAAELQLDDKGEEQEDEDVAACPCKTPALTVSGTVAWWGACEGELPTHGEAAWRA